MALKVRWKFMKLKDYILSLDRGGCKNLACSLGVSSSYLSQMAAGITSVSPARCVELEQLTDGRVNRKDLRPNDWDKIWPELI
jgi:DNA-binding transcriptional regulator YdaS (Cro superfamily)